MGRSYFITFVLLVVLIISSGWLFLPTYIDQKVKQAVAGISTTASQLPALISPTPKALDTANSIMFVSDVTGNNEIYSLNLDNKKMVNLTENPAEDMNPQLSPDGRSIVFYSNRSGNNQIYQLELQNREIKQLTRNSFQDFDPSYSPDGKTIVFKSNRDDQIGDIFIMNADGSGQKNLTPNRRTTEEWDPTFSVDGDRIIFVVRRGTDDRTDELFVMNKDGNGVKQLTVNRIVDWYPSVNPKTGRILFVSREAGETTDDLYLMEENGTNRGRIISLLGNDADPSWDATGEKIIFIRENETNYDLYMMQEDGSELTKILTTDKDELSPIFISSTK